MSGGSLGSADGGSWPLAPRREDFDLQRQPGAENGGHAGDHSDEDVWAPRAETQRTAEEVRRSQAAVPLGFIRLQRGSIAGERISFACNARYKGVAEKVNGFGQDEVFGMDSGMVPERGRLPSRLTWAAMQSSGARNRGEPGWQ